MVFWIVLMFFSIAGGLLVWEGFYSGKMAIEKPLIFHNPIFQLLTMAGAVGYVIVPIMLFSKFGFINAMLLMPLYLLSNFLVYFLIKGFIQSMLDGMK